jgi:hypothetical protein
MVMSLITFSTMSMGHYKIIGDFKHWITSKTRSEYLNAGMQRGQINSEILSEINGEIPGINWANYDNWTKIAPYSFAYGPDGEVGYDLDGLSKYLWRTPHSQLKRHSN